MSGRGERREIRGRDERERKDKREGDEREGERERERTPPLSLPPLSVPFLSSHSPKGERRGIGERERRGGGRDRGESEVWVWW